MKLRTAALAGMVLATMTLAVFTPASAPIKASGVTDVSTGQAHTCALVEGGGAKCWGINQYGELGNDTTIGSGSVVPVEVMGVAPDVRAISAGGTRTCAVMANGGVECWGLGPLGDGSLEASAQPVRIVGVSGAVMVSAGARHVCVVNTGGELQCWGADFSGQLGNGSRCYRFCLTPQEVALPSVSAVSSGGGHTCAVTTLGGVWCWGENDQGQLGDGTTEQRTEPVQVSGMTSGAIAVAAGSNHSCAVMNSGQVKCWGWNLSGQLGDGTTTDRPTPVEVSGISNAIAIDVGGGSTCALTGGGAVLCWGANSSGQLGNGTRTDSSTPVEVSGLNSGVASISVGAGGGYACAVTTSGIAKCWGQNSFGELGDGTTIRRTSPVDTIGLKALLGDVNCDAVTNSVDAALVLQLIAGLVSSLLCEQDADVSQNGLTNSVDAALILQFVAGLIPTLPP